MNRFRNSTSAHPSPALRAPSPLVRRGERDGVRIPRTLISRFVPVNRNAAFRWPAAAWARVAEILERSLQAAARSGPANARRTFPAAQRGESPSSVNAAFHRRFMGRGARLGSWPVSRSEWNKGLSLNRPKLRKVLDCASPLALSSGEPAFQKRQRTGALQDAGATTKAPVGSGSRCAIKKPWRLPLNRFPERRHVAGLASTIQFVWERAASRPLSSASRRRLPCAERRCRLVRSLCAVGQSAGRRLVRPGQSRSPIQSHRSGLNRAKGRSPLVSAIWQPGATFVVLSRLQVGAPTGSSFRRAADLGIGGCP